MSRLTPPVSDIDHIQGPASTPLTLVEYGDYQCPYCGEAYPILKKIQQSFGKKLRIVFRNFPLSNVHPMAFPAAVAAEAADRQGRFWEMHDMIFENQDELSETALFQFGKALGLDLNVFKTDIQDKTISEKVEADFESGIRSGVNKTPSLFINGHLYNGDYEYETLRAALQQHVG